MAIKPEHRLKVGAWEYLPERDKLVKFDANGQLLETAELDNLCQNVMNYLMVHAGELVSKDDLLEKVWGIRAVSDGRITRVIRVLRVALGDDSRTPTYIETVPKRGYRLVAPVERADEPPASKVSEPTQINSMDEEVIVTPAGSSWQRRTLLSVLVLMPLLLAGYFWLATQPAEDDFSAIPLWRYEPVTFLDGIEFYHSISPDEELLAFSYASSPSDSVVRLKLQNLKTHQVVALTEAPYSSFGAAWSPDGTQLAYQRLLVGKSCEIRVIELNNERSRVANDYPLTSCGVDSVSARLSWSQDGRYIVFPTKHSSGEQMSLMLQPAAGGHAEFLTAPPANGFGDYAARFSRSGQQLAFLRHAAGSVQVWLMDLSSRSTRMIHQLNDSFPGNVDWSLDDEYILYPAGRTALAKVSVATGKTSILAYTNNVAREIQITPTGRILASVGAFSQQNIIRVPNRLTNEGTTDAERVFSSNRSESFAEASLAEDGAVAVVSRRSGLPQVWLFYPDGRQRQLTQFIQNERISELAFSPDGRYLLALISQSLWVLPLDGEPKRISTSNETGIASLSWEHTGAGFYYAASFQGSWRVMYRSIHEIDKENVFATDKALYKESPDGSYAVWRDNDNRQLFLTSKDSGEVWSLDDLGLSSPPLELLITNSGLYFSAYLSNNRYQVYHLDFANFKVEKAIEHDGSYSSYFSLSADQKYFYISSMGQGDLDIAEISIENQNL